MFHFYVFLLSKLSIGDHVQILFCIGIPNLGVINEDRIGKNQFVCELSTSGSSANETIVLLSVSGISSV